MPRRVSLPVRSCLLAAAVLSAGLAPQSAHAQATFNYAEALQKSIFFYEAQISGPKPSWSRVTWRGNSAMADGQDVGRDLAGGWFDAGDHVKFGFAMASSATMLAWGGVEYRSAFESKGQLPHLLNNLRVANDYFIKAHSAPNELWGQVGSGGSDHSFWGSAEVMHLRTNRPSFRITATCGGSDLAAETAAAMAASSIVFRPTDPAYANTLLTHARQLFTFAEATHPSFYVDCIPDAAGFYNSHFGNPNDEMAWAAAWLHKATGEAPFLTRARQLYGTMCTESGTTTPCFTWSQSWNDKHFGTYVLMAQLTGEQRFHDDVRRWLNYWTEGAGATTRTTAGGLMFVHSFAPIRYATNAALLALVYTEVIGSGDPDFSQYRNFARRQVDYALGFNPRNSSYVVGFGNNPPRNPHHRTAHGTWNNSVTAEPNPSRHTLFGGLVGGPTQDDNWTDDRGNFERTEVATDFNAGLTGALARLAQLFGGNPLPAFPPVETPADEIFIDAQINVVGQNFTEIRAWLTNQSAWPSRVLSQGTFRYYFTLEPGVTPPQVTLNGNFNQCGSGNLSGPTQFSGSIYFVTVSCVATNVYPGGQDVYRREVQFRIAVPANVPGNWDTSNDYSIQGLTTGAATRTRRIVAFDNGVRIWGDEPGANPDFSLSATPASVAVVQGGTPASSTMGVARISGFTGTVALTAGPLPAGVTAAFTPASVANPGTSSTLTFTASATATVGTHAVTVTGTSGALVRTTPLTLVVSPAQPPNFTLSATPASVTVVRAGPNATSTIGIVRSGGFTGAVALTAGPLPTGVTAAFNPPSTTGAGSTLTFTASATAVLGTSTVTVTGTGGTLIRTMPLTLTVNAAQNPDFSLSAAPPSVTVVRAGPNATSTIGIARSGGFTGAVALTAGPLPTGLTAAFNPPSTTGGSSTLTFTASATATLGTTTVAVTGTSGTLIRTTPITLTVAQAQVPDFSLSATPPSVSVVRGAAAGSTIAIARVNGFTAAVALTASPLPTGVTAAFNPASATGNSSTLTFTASATATLGTSTVTVTGTSGSLVRTTPLTLTVSGDTGGGGVTVTPVINANGPYYNEEAVRLGNTGTLTALSVTIVIQRTPGVSFSGMYNTVGGQILQSNSSTAAAITYQWTLAAGQTLGASTNRLFAAQAGGTGTAHPTAGDTWAVTFTTGGATFTQTGTFGGGSGDFSLAASPTAVTVAQGGSGASTVAITRTGGFTGTVAFTASGLPSGVTAAFNPASAAGASSAVTLTASATAAGGTFPVTITGTSGGLTHTASVSLSVALPAGFTLAANPASLSVTQGASGSSTLALTRTGGFTASVACSASGVPAGVTTAFSPATTTGNSILATLTASSTATTGTSTITLSCTGGGITRTAPLSLTLTPPGTTNAYIERFFDMWEELHGVGGDNGYFHPAGVPYHSVETLICEAPDHGHETTSEAYSYWVWLEAMYGNLTGNWTPLQQAFDSVESFIIPTAADQPTGGFYNPADPADYAGEFDLPNQYPSPISSTIPVGTDPIGAELRTTYGNSNIYGMHWLLDVDNFYGYGRRGDGTSQPSYINTFQRGPQESVWETVPHPSWEDFQWGSGGAAGFLPLFISGPAPARQWRYTNAPDADARLVQAMYWAKVFADARGGSAAVDALVAKAATMGDYLRYALFDKYFKTMGCTSTACPAGSGYNAAHYLLSWYYAWGGPIDPAGGWSFRIGSSHNHFGYQNPMAAHALSQVPALRPRSPNAARDWTTSLGRQIEFYRWLQSADGAIAGGATNSWGGRYAVPPAGVATFYSMFFDSAPVFRDPPSNQWFGFQAWSMERVAEYYYVTGNDRAKLILDKWVPWAMSQTRLLPGGGYEIPSDQQWTGQPSLNWNATTQNWNAADTAYNSGLRVTVTAFTQDAGVAAALAKTLTYYSAGTARWAIPHAASRALAKELLDRMWILYRDDIGVSVPETRSDYNRFDDPVFVPPGFAGAMKNGDPIGASSTFIGIRSSYRDDPAWPQVQTYLDGGPAPTFRYHRFWAQVDIALANAEYGRLFP